MSEIKIMYVCMYILSLCYGGHNVPYMKNSTFTEYEFAFLLLHSAKLNF